MDKSLVAHRHYVETQMQNVHDFQHERQVHLQVTFFFSTLLLLAIGGLLWTASLDVAGMFTVTILLLAAGIILFGTVLAYVRHYYKLENGVQGLYELTKELRDIIAS